MAGVGGGEVREEGEEGHLSFYFSVGEEASVDDGVGGCVLCWLGSQKIT